MTPAGTSYELDVQNGWEENTHTHCRESVGTGPVVLKAVRVTGAAFASPRTKCYCAPLFSHTHYCCGDAKAAPVTRTALRTTGPVPTDSRQCSNNNYVLKSNIYDDTVSCALNFLRVDYRLSRGLEKIVPQNSTALDYSSTNILVYSR